MSAYTEEVLVDKLSKLNNTQQSIQTLSHWIMYHRKRCAQSIQVWDREIYRAPKERKLVFLYLANDIMQISRKKGGEFIKEFARVMPGAIMHVHRECDADDKKSLQRVIQIWEERKVFPPEFVDNIRKSVQGSSVEKIHSAVPQELIDSTKSSEVTSKFEPVVFVLREVDAKEVNIALILEKFGSISPSLIPGERLQGCSNQAEVTELAIELEENINVINSYKQELQDYNQLRKKLISVLRECIDGQEKDIASTQGMIQDCDKRLARTEVLKVELKNLYDSLSPANQSYIINGTATPPPPPPAQNHLQSHYVQAQQLRPAAQTTTPPSPRMHPPAPPLLQAQPLSSPLLPSQSALSNSIKRGLVGGGEEDPLAKKGRLSPQAPLLPQPPIPPPPLNLHPSLSSVVPPHLNLIHHNPVVNPLTSLAPFGTPQLHFNNTLHVQHPNAHAAFPINPLNGPQLWNLGNALHNPFRQ